MSNILQFKANVIKQDQKHQTIINFILDQLLVANKIYKENVPWGVLIEKKTSILADLDNLIQELRFLPESVESIPEIAGLNQLSVLDIKNIRNIIKQQLDLIIQQESKSETTAIAAHSIDRRPPIKKTTIAAPTEVAVPTDYSIDGIRPMVSFSGEASTRPSTGKRLSSPGVVIKPSSSPSTAPSVTGDSSAPPPVKEKSSAPSVTGESSPRTSIVASVDLALPQPKSLKQIKADLKNIISLELLSLPTLSDPEKTQLIVGLNDYIEKYFFKHINTEFVNEIDFDNCGTFQFDISVNNFMRNAKAHRYYGKLFTREVEEKVQCILNNCLLENSFTNQPRFQDIKVLKDRLYFNVVKFLHQATPSLSASSQIPSLLNSFNHYIYDLLLSNFSSGNMPSAEDVQTIKRSIQDAGLNHWRYKILPKQAKRDIIEIMGNTLNEYLSYAQKNVIKKKPIRSAAAGSASLALPKGSFANSAEQKAERIPHVYKLFKELKAKRDSGEATDVDSELICSSSTRLPKPVVHHGSSSSSNVPKIEFFNRTTQDQIKNLTTPAVGFISGRTKVAAVNLANRHSIGGGCRNGAMAQEESLCYTSDLYFKLCKGYSLGYKYEDSRVKPLPSSYEQPIPHNSIMFSTNVEFSYAQQEDGITFEPLEQPFYCDMITVAGYDLGCGTDRKHQQTLKHLNATDPLEQQLIDAYEADLKVAKSNGQDTYDFPEFAKKFTELTAEKIKLILKAALAKDIDSIVLGAISCGAFKFATSKADRIQLEDGENWTVKCVCEAYKTAFQELLNEGYPLHNFKNISFAVTGPDNGSFPNVEHFKQLPKELDKIFHTHYARKPDLSKKSIR